MHVILLLDALPLLHSAPFSYSAYGHIRLRVHYNEEIAFAYTEVLVLSCTTHPGKALQRFCWRKALCTEKEPFLREMKVYKCTNCVLDSLN